MRMQKYRLGWLLFALLLGQVCLADTPTPEALCRQRNAASCEMSGLKFFIEDEECPRGAKVLRPHGHENCSPQVPVQVNQLPGAVPGAVQSAPTASGFAPVATEETAAANFWSSPYFYLLLIGLLQGLISRAALGPVLTVAVVMPLLAGWVLLPDRSAQLLPAAYWAYAAMLLLKTFLCSMAGWGAGMAIRMGVFKLPFR